MKNIKRLVAAAAICVFSVSAVGCNMISKTPEAIRKTVVAKVNNETVTKGEVDDKLKPMLEQVKAQYGENYESNEQIKAAIEKQKTQILEQLVLGKLIMQTGKDKKLVPTEAKLKEEADKEIAEIKKQYPDDAKFKEILKQQGYTEETLDAEIKDSIIQRKVYDSVTKDIKVEDKEVEADYNQYKTTKYTEKPNQIKLAHILVKTEDEAKKVKERLAKNEDFGALAKELSQDTGSKDKGGEYTVPYVGSNFDPAFMKVALATEEGKITEPVQTQFGWHVIKVIKKEEYPAKKFETVKEDIHKELLNNKQSEAWKKAVDGWKSKAKIKEYPEKL